MRVPRAQNPKKSLVLGFRLVIDNKISYYYSLEVVGVSWAPNRKNNTLKKSTMGRR